MTLTASKVTAEDKAAFAVPPRSWQVLLQFKLQRMQLLHMAPGVSWVNEKFDGQELALLVQLMRQHNRSLKQC